ncbi:GRAM domain-containing protein 2B isoform X2 [Triplophysa rosa]|uniref:GRAM domain-containing protein 2B isoform X2 n=1 Tax=Triplophysa rosa TaxID=992332 RepID=UPI00254609A2|nr:GRAM domain-containing protein 2B isoform X2 [Triplophysa rosa]
MSRKAHRRFSLDSSGNHLDINAVSVKFKSSMLRRSSEGKSFQNPEESHLDVLDHNSRSTAIEEETLDRPDGLLLRKSLKNHYKTFHKLFPEIPETEDLKHVFTCALQKEVIYHGKMYVLQHHVCFHSSVLLKETKYLFVSLRNREVCFKLLVSLCTQLQSEKISHDLKTENQHDTTTDTISCPSSLEDDHREELKSVNTTQSVHRVSCVAMVTEKITSVLSFHDTSILNKLLVFYLILVVLLLLSSGYIGLRMVALEEQLSTLGALPEFTRQREYNET